MPTKSDVADDGDNADDDDDDDECDGGARQKLKVRKSELSSSVARGERHFQIHM